MNSLGLLIKGEFQRLIKYKIFQVGFAVSVLWILMLFLIGKENAGIFVPIFIFMDISLMTVLLIGSSLFYERQENTLKTLLITPVKLSHIIFSKLLSSIYIAFQSTILIALVASFFFGVDINLLLLLLFSILISCAHAMIGFLFAVWLKDFASLLAAMMLYMVIFAFPSIFYAFGVLGRTWEMVLIFSPTHASLLLIDYAFYAEVRLGLIVVSLIYLTSISYVFGRYLVFPRYVEKAIKE